MIQLINICIRFVYRRIMDFSVNFLLYFWPKETLQRRSFLFSQSMGAILAWTFGARQLGTPSYEAHIFNSLITRLSRISPGLALDIIVDNRSLLTESLQHGKGVVIATVHSQLSLSLHSIRDSKGRPPLFVGNHHDDMTGWNWGSIDPIEALNAQDSMVLMHVRSALTSGRIVACFVDFNEGPKGPTFTSPNLFALAHLMQVPVLHMLCTLETGGRIRIDLAKEPQNLTDPHKKAEAFVKFIETRLGVRLSIRRPKHT